MSDESIDKPFRIFINRIEFIKTYITTKLTGGLTVDDFNWIINDDHCYIIRHEDSKKYKDNNNVETYTTQHMIQFTMTSTGQIILMLREETVRDRDSHIVHKKKEETEIES